MPTVTRALPAEAQVDEAERTIVATISTAAVDRYNTVIVPEGGRLDNYRKNPVVLYNHDGRGHPIGKNLWIKIDKGRMVAKTKFTPLGVNPDADKVFDLYRLGFLNGWSISFNPTECGKPSPEEIRKRPEIAGCDVVYRAWELLEYSCVTIPGNAEACRQAIARGIALADWVAPPEPEPATAQAPAAGLPPLVGRSLDQVLKATLRQLDEQARSLQGATRRDAIEVARGMV